MDLFNCHEEKKSLTETTSSMENKVL